MENVFTKKDPLLDVINQVVLGEKKLTDAELKKREEIAQAIERENPGMDMGKKMAIATAQAKKVAEEVEQIDESDYKSHFKVRGQYKDKDGNYVGVTHKIKYVKDADHAKRIASEKVGKQYKDYKAIRATPFSEEVEQIDEISKKTLGNYIGKAVVDVHNDAKWAGETDDRDAKNKAFKRLLGVKSAAARLSKQNVSGGRISNFRREEVDLEEQLENFWDAYLTCLDEAKDDSSQQALLLRAMAKDPSDLMKMKRAISMGDKALTNPVMRQEILKMLDQMMNLTVTDKALLQKTRSSFMKQKQFKAADTTNTEEYVPEEVEELDELSKGTLNKYVRAAADGPTGVVRSKDMASRFSNPYVKDFMNNRAEKRIKGINTAMKKLNKLTKEEVEELDELSKDTLGNYIKKAATGMNGMAVHAHMSGSASSAEQREKHFDKAFKRGKGIAKAADKLTKEEAEQVVSEESQYAWKIEGGSGKGKEFGHKNTTVDDHLSAMKHHSAEYRKAMDDKRDADARHHGMKYHKHKDQIERLGTVGEYRKEEVEELDEISKKTLGSYIKKANADANDNAVRASWETSRIAVGDPNDPGSHNKANKYIRDLRNRKKGISRATDKLTKEEVDTGQDAARKKQPSSKEEQEKVFAKHKERMKKLASEEVEQIDELSKKTLGSYIKKATSDVVNKAVLYSHDAAKVSSKAPSTRTDSDYDKLRVGERGLAKRRKGIDLAVKKLTKEEADKDAPFDGGREVKSSKPAAERVKKIAKGMQKHYTKDKK